ncbi:RusA family crossover junction endodeoxyribonuclease [Pleomorphovibrio marinus]|uniref:RusA family crossover junction endodeoxyribonuclease n=1 Tax=Pleomorphovibrio marinus TaxID=2164132 RepID=UPI000E0A0FA7|nr:RusA family crossover junction endodeoxyribonuclease [Pleomorphovibrio marinus]
MKAILKKHPELDFFIGFIGGPEIPTKQDKFKPLMGYKAILEDEEGKTTDLSEEFDLYLKKKGKSNHQDFETKFKQQIKENLTDEHPYKKSVKLEVIVSISMQEKRLNSVDIDNLIKSVLDCFNGLVYEDDSQIVSVLGRKDVNGYFPRNGIFVGIRKIIEDKESWFKNIKLAYFEYKN